MENCYLPEWVIKKYPIEENLLLFSSTGNSLTNSATGIITELQELGSASAGTDGATIRDFRLLRSDSHIQQKNIFVVKAEFDAYDTTISGGTGQDANTVTDVNSSTPVSLKLYVHSSYRNAMLPQNWQPNGFSPQMWVNGQQVINGNDTPADISTPLPLMSMGYPLTYSFKIEREILFYNSISIKAGLGQYVASQDKWQNYPMMARIIFRREAF